MDNLETMEHLNGSEIAIIGMACNFPGANNPDAFWQNLRDGVESISFLTDEELEPSGIDIASPNDPNYVKAASILDNVDLFDASFFGFTPREAELMDPQHRLLLECAWEVLEHAGYDPKTYKGSIGMYAGAETSTYLFNLYSNQDILGSLGSFSVGMGNSLGLLGTRVSYKLNLKGPSYSVQTACSTSLAAVHLACQSLLIDECQMALAGAARVFVPHKTGYLYETEGILSPDGHCRAFDAKAQGTIFGSGVGIVLLKRLEAALADGDCIHAVIKGSATNNDGSLKASFTAPSVYGQTEVILDAVANAEVEAESITYVETHGTGTYLGDPIEIQALTKAFRATTDKKGFCAIGSVKTNVGHLDVASGMASLIKTVLALKHKQLPPSLHFEQPNPHIDFENSPFYVNTTLSEWKAGRTPRRAGVSSFGFGGTNAHLILEEAPPIENSGLSRPWQLLLLSAKTSSALETATTNLVEYLKKNPALNLADVAYTLQVGRRAFNYRRMVVCSDIEDAVNALEILDSQRVSTNFQESSDRPAVFMFPGQGAQYVNMALELYQVEPTFRKQVDICAELLTPHLGLDLRTVLYPSEEQAEEAMQQLNQTIITQPALFVIEYALAKLWMEWGVRPQVMIGHSIGEYVAACLAGVFSLEDALALVAARGRMMQELPNGAMIAVPLSEEEVQPLLGQKLSLAAINGPGWCVVSGPTDAVDELEQQLAEQGLVYRRLHTSHAFHSEMMNPILEPFTEQVKRVNLKPPQIPYVSNVTGTWITAAEATDPSYWAKHLRSSVRFAEGVHELLKEPDQILLEVGPGETLSTLAKLQVDSTHAQVVLSSLRHPHVRRADVALLLNTLSKLWLAGVQVNWSGVYTHQRRHRLPLPTYPFERQRYWIEPKKLTDDGGKSQATIGKKPDIADWFYIPSWKHSMPPKPFKLGDLAGHQQCWLVFVDECDLGSPMVRQLAQERQNVISVMVGEQFSRVSDSVYTINPRQRDDYEALLKELCALNKTPNMIVHLWSVAPKNYTQSGIEFFKKAQDLGFYSLLFLAQALGEQNVTDPLQIIIVSSNLYEVTGEEVLCPEKATVLGPCKVIPQEYPNITCRCIDVVVPDSGTQQKEELIEQVLAESRAKSLDVVIAYRGHHRWVQTFEPVRLTDKAEHVTRLRKNGVYLITGGLGGVGLVIAEYLAQTVQAKLVLIGRSALPAVEEWKQWLETHNDQDRTSRKIRKVQALEALGAEVLVLNADAANLEQMQSVLTQSFERFGEIHGVIHAAGIAGGGLIQVKTPEVAESVLSSKVQGLLVLDAMFKNTKLDFLVFFSSIASILGEFGQVDYCAANAFLDTFAHYSVSSNNTFTVSINWDTWQEVGMAVNTAVPLELRKMREQTLKEGITPTEGVEAFGRILSRSTLPQVVVSTKDLQATIDNVNAFARSPILEAIEKTQISRLMHPRPNLQNIYVAPRNEIEQTIADIWEQLLGIEQVGIYDNFFDLGGHSLLATMLVARLRDAFHLDLPLHKVFEAATVAELALSIADIQVKEENHEEMEILKMVAQLSEEEVDREVEKRMRSIDLI